MDSNNWHWVEKVPGGFSPIPGVASASGLPVFDPATDIVFETASEAVRYARDSPMEFGVDYPSEVDDALLYEKYHRHESNRGD